MRVNSHRFRHLIFLILFSLPSIDLPSQNGSAEILSISPTVGPEGSRVEVSGRNLGDATTVLFGKTAATFRSDSSDKLVALVPRWATTSIITVVTPQGRAASPSAFVVANDPRIPDGVGWKAGYVNPTAAPRDFRSVLLWGIAIADTRVSCYESAQIEVAWAKLSCRADGSDVVLNDDRGKVRGGLYIRYPWFGAGDYHEPMPFSYDLPDHAVILRVGQRADRVWHFWTASPRPALPPGKLEGCTAKARVRISGGALMQLGMDYWRSTTALWAGSDVNNHEAGVSNWYFPSSQWQEVTFTDIGGPQF